MSSGSFWMNVSCTSLFWIVATRLIVPSWRTVVRKRLPAIFVTFAMSIPMPFWLEMTYSPGARGCALDDGPAGIVCERTVCTPPTPRMG